MSSVAAATLPTLGEGGGGEGEDQVQYDVDTQAAAESSSALALKAKMKEVTSSAELLLKLARLFAEAGAEVRMYV